MSWQPVAKVSDLEEETPLVVDIQDDEIAIVKIAEEIYAIRDLCSHGYFQLSEGDIDPQECTIECLAHGSVFDLRTGKPKNLPATRPVPVYPCRIDGSDILLDVHNPKMMEN